MKEHRILDPFLPDRISREYTQNGYLDHFATAYARKLKKNEVFYKNHVIYIIKHSLAA